MVHDPTYYEKKGGFPAHYQVKISRKGASPAGHGRPLHQLDRPQRRVNIGSADQSSNVVHDASVFKNLRAAIHTIASEQNRAPLQDAATTWRKAKDSPGRLAAYKDFMAPAANDMTILAPFLPALSALL